MNLENMIFVCLFICLFVLDNCFIVCLFMFLVAAVEPSEWDGIIQYAQALSSCRESAGI